MKSLLFALSVVCALGLQAAKTVYVNCQFDSYAGHDGSTPEKALRTIQEGINKALTSGDTVYVAPGVYNEGFGGAVKSWGPSRIGWNNRGINIIATSSNPADTVIVGERSSDTPEGYGAGGMRCVAVYNGAGSVIKGFTLRNGHSESTAVKDATSGRQYQCYFGGAVCVDNQNFTIADCIIEDCSAESCGAAYCGTYVRCRITSCTSKDGAKLFSASGNAETTRARLYCCVFDHNGNAGWTTDGGIMIYSTTAWNCTFVNNAFSSCSYRKDKTEAQNASFFNCMFWNTGSCNELCEYTDCLSDADEPRPILSTIHADVRLLPESKAIGAGVAANLCGFSLSEAAATVVGLTDFGGNVLPSEGRIAVGATQTVATPVAGGIASLGKNSTCVDGFRLKKDAVNYAFPTVYPTQYLFTATSTDPTIRLCNFRFIGNYKDPYDYRFPDRSDRLWVMPPARIGSVITNDSTAFGTVVYLKPDADASVADGSEVRPYRTFSAAIAAQGDSKVYVAKAGTYAEGVVTNATYGLVRMHLVNVLRITSEEGPEKTFIVGAKDTSEDADAYGRGPNAVRAISCNSNMPQVQGFTITGCYSDKGNSQKAQGAAVWGNNYTHIDDCIITNNFGMEGVIFGGWTARSYIADNHTCDYVLSGTRCSGCVLERNEVEHPKNGLIGVSAKFVHSLLIGNQGPDDKCYANSYTYRYGSVFLYGSTAAATGSGAGNIYAFMDSVAEGAGGIAADPLLTDAANGDFHPFVRSPVYVCGVRPTMDNYADDYWYYVSTDFEGNPITFDDGVPVAGAFMKPTDRSIVAVDAVKGGLSVTGDRVVLTDDGSVEIAAGEGSRPCVGVTVDGVTNLFADVASVRISAEQAKGGTVASAIYSDRWYVDAENGNDDNTGFMPATAKKTLAAVLCVGLLPGDTVCAAEGVYAEKTMKANDTDLVPVRAIVPDGVTLLATGDRDRTVIEGEAADVPDSSDYDPAQYPSAADMRGMGAGAVKCVRLGAGSRVVGFTLKGGNTRSETGKTNGNDFTGGGVSAYDGARNNSWAEDCFVTNCAAYRGGGAFGVRCKRCEFVDNLAVYGGGATSDAYLYGCLSRNNKCHFPWNNAHRGHLWNYLSDGCTVLDGLVTANAASKPRILNSVMTGTIDVRAVAGADALHDVFVGTVGQGTFTNGWMAAATGTIVTNAAAIALDDFGRPTPGVSVACENADPSVSTYEIGATDVYGGQRIYNGAMDSGAVEADWRSVYAKDIRKRDISVTEASETVIDHGDGIVTLNGESSLTAIWANPRQLDGKKVVQMNVTGNGTLVVKLNGETVKEVTSATADPTFTFDNTLAENTLEFGYVPGEDDTGHAEILGAKSLRGVLLFVR